MKTLTTKQQEEIKNLKNGKAKMISVKGERNFGHIMIVKIYRNDYEAYYETYYVAHSIKNNDFVSSGDFMYKVNYEKLIELFDNRFDQRFN